MPLQVAYSTGPTGKPVQKSMPGSDCSVLGEIAVVSCEVCKPKGMVSTFLLSPSYRFFAAIAPLSGRPCGLSYEST
jgi:hypothetical protein